MEKDGIVCLVVYLLASVANLKIYEKVLPIYPNEHTMRKDSAYLADFRVLAGNHLPIIYSIWGVIQKLSV